MDHAARSFSAEELLRHAGFLSRLARELVSDEHRAADVVQEVYVAALERPPRSAGALRGWLAKVVQNLARNAQRAESRRVRREEQVARPERLKPGDMALERLEIQRVLFELVLALPEEKRTVLYLRYYEGLTPSAIAERLGAPVKTVKTRHTRALAELRERLDARSKGDRTAWMSALLPLVPPRGSLVPRAATAGILGGLAMKKLVVAVGVVLVGWLVWQRTRGAEPAVGEARVESTLAAPPSPAEAVAVEPEPERVAAPAATGTRHALADETPPNTGGLRVKLRWSDGTPAAGIGMDVKCENDPAPREERFRGVTGEDGVALFEELFAGPVDLDLDRGVRFEAEVAAGSRQTAELTIPEGFDVEGLVVDPEGQPVSGAEIWGEGREWRWPDGKLLTRTAADGSFRLRGIGEYARGFGARAPGHQPSVVFLPAGLPVGPHGTRIVTLELGAPGGRVEGRVLDPYGKPIAGALVQAGPRGGYIVDSPSGLRGKTAAPLPIESGPGGSFALAGDLEPGIQPIHALARGFPVWEGSVRVTEGSTAIIEIRLQRPASVVGRVVTAAGEPVPNATVVAAHEEGGGWYFHSFPPPEATTDEGGNFTLGWVAPGDCEINASVRFRSRLGRGRAIVTCLAGQSSTCLIELDLGLTISGRVIDASGRPLAGWNVYDDPVQKGGVYPRQEVTDEQGRFLLANLGECAHDILVSAPFEFPSPPRAKIAGVRPGAEDVVLVVEDPGLRKGRFRGLFLGVDGRPPQDANLVLYPEGERSGPHIDFDPATGAFAHQALPGRYVLVGQGGNRTLAWSEPFEIMEGTDVDLGELRIEPPGRVELVVHGVPVEELAALGIRLDRIQSGSEDLEYADGVLRSRELAPGTWSITMGGNERFLRAREVVIVSGETTRLELEIERAFPLALACRLARDGWSVVTIEARDAGGNLLQGRRLSPGHLADGQPVRLALPEGPTTIEARTDTGLRASATIDIGPELIGAPPLELTLSRP